jgi:hypothetical protein
MTGAFPDHVSLLTRLLDRRHDIVENIERRVLNVQGKRASRDVPRGEIDRLFHGCFFDAPGLPSDLSRLHGHLAAAHIADGFEPVRLDASSDRLDPLDLVARAHRHWEQHRWPGRNGRIAYARRLYSVFILRQLEYLSLRIWDEGNDRAGDRLQDVQHLLDRLNGLASPDVFVRDARWLIQTAQGPLTRQVRPYFRIAEQISGSLADADRLEVHKAGAQLAGGHLRSQLRYRSGETGEPIDHPDVLSVTRNSNSMDTALLVGDLVPLLEAYRTACVGEHLDERLDLADAVLQGLSADPELLLTRLDLLTPCTMIEDLFICMGGDGRARYTPMGHAHLGLLERYGRLIGELAEPLKVDACRFDPSRRVYSPFGIAYGFCADILSGMAMESLMSLRSSGLGLEDLFDSGANQEDTRARADGWRTLPGRDAEREHFEHSIEWADQIFQRLMRALEARAEPHASNLLTGRLFVVPQPFSLESLPAGFLPAGVVRAEEHSVTSDLTRAFSSGATAFPRSQVLTDRNEGRFLASAESDGKWFGVSKVVLTVCTSQGKDALITGVPPAVVEILRLTCPGLVTVAQAPGGDPA